MTGWRLKRPGLEALGWFGLAVQIGLAALIFGQGLTDVSLLRGGAPLVALYADNDAVPLMGFGLATLPRLLFLISLLVWARHMLPHALTLTAAVSVCFIGIIGYLITFAFNGWSLTDQAATLQEHPVLAHTTLYLPFLLAVPAFLTPIGARARLTILAWTGGAATLFAAMAALWLYMDLLGKRSGLADAPIRFADNARDFAMLGFVLLLLWLGALWTHRK